MNKECYLWLEKELPSWVNEKIVTQESAQLLLARYASDLSTKRSSGMAFSVLGFILVGLGIVSILAYNWDVLGHMERTFLAFGLLGAAQLFSFWVKRYKNNEQALREGSGVLWFLMMGSSLAIIGQTYHLGGTFFDFAALWLLLTFTIPWLISSRATAFLQIVLWTGVWLSFRDDGSLLGDIQVDSFIRAWMLMGIALVLGGYYVWQLQKAKESNATLMLSWAVCLCLLVVVMVELFIQTRSMSHMRDVVNGLALLCGLYFCVGKLYVHHGERAWQKPFEYLGTWGAWLLLVSHLSFRSEPLPLAQDFLAMPLTWGFIIFWIGFIALLVLFAQKSKTIPAETLVLATPFIFLVQGFLNKETMPSPLTSLLFINVSFLLGASWMLYCGAKEGKIGLINQGMVLIALAIWIHFMDANFDLVAKGVAFIVTGTLFLAINAFVRKRLKADA